MSSELPSSDAVSPKFEQPGKSLGGPQADESEDSDKVKVACAPCMPTQEEVDLHNTTHYPFRSWCKF